MNISDDTFNKIIGIVSIVFIFLSLVSCIIIIILYLHRLLCSDTNAKTSTDICEKSFVESKQGYSVLSSSFNLGTSIVSQKNQNNCLTRVGLTFQYMLFMILSILIVCILSAITYFSKNKWEKVISFLERFFDMFDLCWKVNLSRIFYRTTLTNIKVTLKRIKIDIIVSFIVNIGISIGFCFLNKNFVWIYLGFLLICAILIIFFLIKSSKFYKKQLSFSYDEKDMIIVYGHFRYLVKMFILFGSYSLILIGFESTLYIIQGEQFYFDNVSEIKGINKIILLIYLIIKNSNGLVCSILFTYFFRDNTPTEIDSPAIENLVQSELLKMNDNDICLDKIKD